RCSNARGQLHRRSQSSAARSTGPKPLASSGSVPSPSNATLRRAIRDKATKAAAPTTCASRQRRAGTMAASTASAIRPTSPRAAAGGSSASEVARCSMMVNDSGSLPAINVNHQTGGLRGPSPGWPGQRTHRAHPGAAGALVRPAHRLSPELETQLLQAELEDVDQAAPPLAQAAGLEKGLLLERVEVEVLGQEVDEGLVVDAALDQIAVGTRPTRPLEILQHDCADPGPHGGRQSVRRLLAPTHHPLAILGARQLAMDHELAQPAEDDVEASVRKLLRPRQLAHGPHAEDLGTAGVVLLPVAPQQHHADQPRALDGV